MKTYALLIVLLAVTGISYLYNQHPEWFSKLLQPDVTPSTAPTPATVVQSVPTPAPVAEFAAAPVPSPVPKQWERPSVSTVYPTEWTLPDGTQYHKVKVLSVDADAVNIEHADGICLIDDTSLPTYIQRLVNYDPEFAQDAAAKRKAGEQQSDQAWVQAQATPVPTQAPVYAPRGPSRAEQIADLKAQIADLLDQADQADKDQQRDHQLYNPDTTITIDAGDPYRRKAAVVQNKIMNLAVY